MIQLHINTFVLVIFTFSLTSLTRGQGCEPYSKFPNHTMCIYKANNCSGNSTILRKGFNQTEKDAIVNEHNRLRKKLDSLNLMEDLSWDNEMATIAQRLADQCVFQHDDNRKVDRFDVGQNIYIKSKFPVDKDLSPDGIIAVRAWFDEVTSPKFNPQNVAPIVAYESVYVGCGYTMYKDDAGWSHKFYVCNYGPTGSTVTGTMWFGRGLSALSALFNMNT